MNVTSYIFRAFAGLMTATVFGTALAYLLAMAYAWATLTVQGESAVIGPGIIAGSFGAGAVQSLATLPATIPVGGVAHIGLLVLQQKGIVAHALAGIVVAGVAGATLGLFEGFNFTPAFVTIVGVSGLLGGTLFWLVARPDQAFS